MVYARSGVRPRDTLQLESAHIAVRAGSAQERILQRLKSTVAPALQWVETAPSSADPVEDVDSGEAQYAIIDAREFSFAHHLYPNVLVGFALAEERPVQWLVRRDAPELLASVDAFFRDLGASGRLAQLLQESSGDTRRFAYEESREFQTHVADRLPLYRPWFEAAATQSGLDWRLLAAIGYQESKWDPRAQSGDGAFGVMMLTADTAQAMGIKRPQRSRAEHFRRRTLPCAGAREDPRAHRRAGPYLADGGRLQRRLRASRGCAHHHAGARQEPGFLERGARAPAAARPGALVRRARRGYARGWEPVQFVDRIQRFLTLLEWQPGESARRGRGGAARPQRCAAPRRAAPGPCRARARGRAAPPAATRTAAQR